MIASNDTSGRLERELTQLHDAGIGRQLYNGELLLSDAGVVRPDSGGELSHPKP
jgi:hypothetical protein